MTRAFQDFAVSFADAQRLFALYDAELERSKPRIPENTEVLKRACLIMAVTAYESFIEDYLREKFPARLASAQSPETFKVLFEIVAKKWMRENNEVPSKLFDWTGEGWKAIIQSHFDQRINALNTPKSEVVVGLFRQFLGIDLAQRWAWQGYGYAQACIRLDEIVELRGRVTHVARKGSNKAVKHEVSRPELKKYLSFFAGMVAATVKDDSNEKA